MSEFINEFINTITQLIQSQISEPSSVVLVVISAAMRFTVLGICIACAVLLIQTIAVLFKKEKRLQSIPLGISFAVLLGTAFAVFSPFAATPPEAASTAALQEIIYKTPEQIAEEQAQAELLAQQAEGESAQPTVEAENSTEQSSEEETEQADLNELQRNVQEQTELTPQQMQAVLDILNETQVTRTLLRQLPEEAGQNILIRLNDNTKWQIMLLQGAGYVYVGEDIGFINEIEDYDSFYNNLLSALSVDYSA